MQNTLSKVISPYFMEEASQNDYFIWRMHDQTDLDSWMYEYLREEVEQQRPYGEDNEVSIVLSAFLASDPSIIHVDQPAQTPPPHTWQKQVHLSQLPERPSLASQKDRSYQEARADRIALRCVSLRPLEIVSTIRTSKQKGPLRDLWCQAKAKCYFLKENGIGKPKHFEVDAEIRIILDRAKPKSISWRSPSESLSVRKDRNRKDLQNKGLCQLLSILPDLRGGAVLGSIVSEDDQRPKILAQKLLRVYSQIYLILSSLLQMLLILSQYLQAWEKDIFFEDF